MNESPNGFFHRCRRWNKNRAAPFAGVELVLPGRSGHAAAFAPNQIAGRICAAAWDFSISPQRGEASATGMPRSMADKAAAKKFTVSSSATTTGPFASARWRQRVQSRSCRRERIGKMLRARAVEPRGGLREARGERG